VVWQNFDFTHLGLASLEDLSTEDIQWRWEFFIDMLYKFDMYLTLVLQPVCPFRWRRLRIYIFQETFLE
jgi:hypothetical protein